MTRDETLNLALKHDICPDARALQFASAIEARVREECAKEIESMMIGETPLTTVMGAIGDAIRARKG